MIKIVGPGRANCVGKSRNFFFSEQTIVGNGQVLFVFKKGGGWVGSREHSWNKKQPAEKPGSRKELGLLKEGKGGCQAGA